MPEDFSIARALASQGQALDQARAKTAAIDYGHDAGGIDELALPPGAGREYVDRMLQRAEGDALPQPEFGPRPTGSGAMPQLNVAQLDPQSRSGSPRSMSDLKPGDSVAVSYLGTRVEVEQAVAMGLLVRNPGGGYRTPSQAEVAQAEQAGQQIQQEQRSQEEGEMPALREAGELPDVDTQSAIDTVVARVPAPAITALIEDMSNNGDMSLSAVSTIAQRAGMTAEQGQALAEKVVDGLVQQAGRAATAAGVPAHEIQALWDWAEVNRPMDIRNARREISLGVGVDAVKKLAHHYLAAQRQAARHHPSSKD